MARAASQPPLDAVTTINDDGSRNFIHPSDVRGRFTTWRAVIGWGLIAVYILLPIVQINGNPAVFLDFENRQAHLFGLSLVPQDFWLGFFLITGLGFSLFFVTAILGRVWCGWACPQTVFIEQVFRRIERYFEGDAQARKQLDRSQWTAEKLRKRGGKLAVFALLAIAIAHIFISYFISLPKLSAIMQRSPLENWSLFAFVFLLSAALFFDFVWFREQFCIVLCPYGRLQSVLIDSDSITIGYDKKRGEPRGKLRAAGAGDCIDCARCVQVCPTGIDIRQGVQIECIACANCIDACDDVMARIGRPPGLVRYDSANGLEGAKTRFLRPRTILYTVLLTIGAVVMSISLSTLRPATVTVLRMPGFPYFVMGGVIRNQYTLRVQNKLNKPVRFKIRLITDKPGINISGIQEGIEVPALGQQTQSIVVMLPEASYQEPFSAQFEVVSESFAVTKAAPFLGPDVNLSLGQ